MNDRDDENQLGDGEGGNTSRIERKGWAGVPPKRAIRDVLVGRARELRKEMTLAERRLWGILRGKGLGVKFRKQHPIDRFIADFYCPVARLIVEVDGATHEDTAEQDATRTVVLEELGLRVVRYTNGEVMGNLEGVVADLRHVIEEQMREG